MSKLFFQNITTTMEKCRRNVKFEEMDNVCSTGKNYGLKLTTQSTVGNI